MDLVDLNLMGIHSICVYFVKGPAGQPLSWYFGELSGVDAPYSHGHTAV